jgi:hypothetical protein
MKVKDIVKKLLEKFDGEQEVVLLNEDRMGHDDAVLDFGLQYGFGNDEKCSDNVRLDEPEDDCSIPCCVIVCNAGG